MSVLAMATADLPLEYENSWTRVTTNARTGLRSFYRSGSSISQPINFRFAQPHSGSLYYRVCFCVDGNYTNHNMYARISNEANILSLVATAGGDVNLLQGSHNGTLLFSIPNAITVDVWVVFEIHVTPTGCTLRHNGLTVFTADDLTFNLDNIIQLSLSGSGSTGATSFRGWVDDIIIRTDGWPGLGGLYVLEPSGAGIHQDWTGALPTLTTDAETANTKHTYTKDALPVNALNISAAGVCTQARVTGHGYGALKSLLGEAEGATVAHSISNQASLQLFDGPWSPAAFDALEVGVASA